RGCGALAPENTLAGLRLAARLGVRAVEFDVMLSADATPWLIHDETLARTTKAVGRVCDTNDAQLRQLDAGSAHHPAFAGEALPTLADAAHLCRALGLYVNLEIKPAAGYEALTGKVVASAARELWAGAPLPLLSSFSALALFAARAAAPELPISCLYDQPPADWLTRFHELAATTLHCQAAAIDDSLLELAAAQQIPLLAYTVNERATAEALFQRGVAAVFTDRLDLIERATA
ncbi:MAG TPA: glycerophosphodiester phosphodiesterase, partial [Accumulibacter sp.]|nr:glycerophosphodiester phosphodiesterase [Accumulibacter sp.]